MTDKILVMKKPLLTPSALGIRCDPKAAHLHAAIVAGAKVVLGASMAVEIEPSEMEEWAFIDQRKRVRYTRLYRSTLVGNVDGRACTVKTEVPDPVLDYVFTKGEQGESPANYGTWLDLRFWLRGEQELDLCWSSHCGWYMSEGVSVVGAGFLKDLELVTGARQLRLITAEVEKSPLVDQRWYQVDLTKVPTRIVCPGRGH